MTTTTRHLLVALLLAATARAQTPIADTEAAANVGKDVIVTGKLVSIRTLDTGLTFLNFGDRHPKQTLTGVILARDAGKVGDIKDFEGKVVTLRGTIELREEKPQILIKAAEQLKLADAANPTPPPPVPGTAPMPAAPAVPAADTRKIALAPNWNSATQGGDMTRKDLAKVFGAASTANPPASITVYPGIPYLTPIADAKKLLKLEGTTSSTTKVTAAGMPIGSFSAQAFTGIFPGGFNRLFLITDIAGQVVSVLLVEDNARSRTPIVPDLDGYHTANFITGRVKGSNDLIVKHDIAASGAPAGVILIDSLLIDPTAPDPSAPPPPVTRSGTISRTPRKPASSKVLERSRWFVPQPIVELILQCVGNR